MQLFYQVLLQAFFYERFGEIEVYGICLEDLVAIEVLEFCSQEQDVLPEDVFAENVAVVFLIQDFACFQMSEFGTSHQRHLTVVVFRGQRSSVSQKKPYGSDCL